MTTKSIRAEMVIVGLGPVGATAANLAGALGFDVLVIDRDLAPFALPRAVAFDTEIMRIFESIGLAERIAAITRPLWGSVYLGADGRPIRTFRSPGPVHDGAWSPTNLFYQPSLETTLRDGLARFGNVRVLAGCEAVDLEDHGERRTLTVSRRDGDVVDIEARFVLGCDGASSLVRRRIGATLDDVGFEERWLVVDVRMKGPMKWPDIYEIPPEVRDGRYSLMVCDPAQPATVIPGVGDHRRWEYRLDARESDAEAVDAAALRRRLSDWVDPDDIELVRSAVYRFRALVAQQWRSGPVFLLGDAAHQTPPFYGQGMCHGVRDAAQLLWKLRLVADGHAPDSLLDSYQVEREPQVREVITASVAAGAAVCITDPKRARERDAEFRAAEAARGRNVAMSDIVPPLRAGLIDVATGGGRLPEFQVGAGSEKRSLDALLNGRFSLLHLAGGDPAPRLSPRVGAAWAGLGGQEIALADSAAPGVVQDSDGRFAAWLESADATAVVVRPDRYIYGRPSGADDVSALVGRLIDAIGSIGAGALTQENARP